MERGLDPPPPVGGFCWTPPPPLLEQANRFRVFGQHGIGGGQGVSWNGRHRGVGLRVSGDDRQRGVWGLHGRQDAASPNQVHGTLIHTAQPPGGTKCSLVIRTRWHLRALVTWQWTRHRTRDVAPMSSSTTFFRALPTGTQQHGFPHSNRVLLPTAFFYNAPQAEQHLGIM